MYAIFGTERKVTFCYHNAMKTMYRTAMALLGCIIQLSMYTCLILQWFWVVVLFTPAFLQLEYFTGLPNTPKPQPPVQMSMDTPVLEFVVISMIVIIVVGFAMYFLVKTPIVAVKYTAKIVDDVAEKTVMPIIEKRVVNHTITKKQRKVLHQNIILGVTSMASLVAAGLVPVAMTMNDRLPANVAYAIGFFLAIMTLVLVVIHVILQYGKSVKK